jgi:hypothetical protein
MVTMVADDELERRKGLTFAQAEGLEPLPRQLARTEVSKEFRAVLWHFVRQELERNRQSIHSNLLQHPWTKVIERLHVHHLHRLDEPSSNFEIVVRQIRPIFEKGSYSEIYGWLQAAIRIHPDQRFSDKVGSLLEDCRAPYRIIDDRIGC